MVDAGRAGHDERADRRERSTAVAALEGPSGIDAGRRDRSPRGTVDECARRRRPILGCRPVDPVAARDERAALRAGEEPGKLERELLSAAALTGNGGQLQIGSPHATIGWTIE